MNTQMHGPGPEKEGPTRVALYIRVTSDQQAKTPDGSPDIQLDVLNRFAEHKKSTGMDWVASQRFGDQG